MRAVFSIFVLCALWGGRLYKYRSYMKRIIITAALAALCLGSIASAQTQAGSPEGGISSEMLSRISGAYRGNAADKAIKNGHAEHIHSNCDCTYAVRHSPDVTVEGYDPDKYLEMYKDAPLKDGQSPSGKNRINAMRRQFYKDNGTTEIEV